MEFKKKSMNIVSYIVVFEFDRVIILTSFTKVDCAKTKNL